MPSSMRPFDIVGSFNKERYPSVDSQRTINLFEYVDRTGKRPNSLFPTAGIGNTGLNFFPETLGSRATFVFRDITYQVFGGSIFEITGTLGNLATSRIGEVETSVGYVGIAANETQIIFVDGQKGNIWDTIRRVFIPITDTNFPVKPIDVTFLDGFLVVINGETNQFQLSQLNEGLVWGTASLNFTADFSANWFILSSTDNFQTGVSFNLTENGTLPVPLNDTDTYYSIFVDSTHIRIAASLEDAHNNIPIILTSDGTPPNLIVSTGEFQLGKVTSSPGRLMACTTLHRRIFFFMEHITEVWENAGIGTNLPFRRNNGLLMEMGTPAIESVVVGFDRLFFLSQSKEGIGSVMEVRGTSPIPVSGYALDYEINQFSQDKTLGVTHVSDARGIILKENGLIFYRLNFTKANHTYVYNVSMSRLGDRKWHEEEVLNGDRHVGQTHAYFQGDNYYASYLTSTFYLVNNTLSRNDGEGIRRVRIPRQVTPENYHRLRTDRFELDIIQGEQTNPLTTFDLLATLDGLNIVTLDGIDISITPASVEQSLEPKVFLSISRDGGQSFGYNLTGTMGKTGDRTHRTIWRKLGVTPSGQGFLPKIEFFSDVQFIILGAAWAVEVLPD